MTTKERDKTAARKLHDWNEAIADLSPVERAADTAAEEALWKDIGRYHLAEISRICDLNQAEIARRLADAPPFDPDTDHPRDYLVSTIRAIVENLGGRLELTAVFGPARVPVDLPRSREEPQGSD